MFYDASLNYSQDKAIRTTVVYSSEIEDVEIKKTTLGISYAFVDKFADKDFRNKIM